MGDVVSGLLKVHLPTPPSVYLMIDHANMHKPCRAVSMLWAWVWVWAWCVPGGWCAAPTPSRLTTGTATTSPKLEDFALTYEKAFATFVELTIRYNATLNFTRVEVSYVEPVDTSRHVITLNINPGGNGFDPTSVYGPGTGRLGFTYRLGGLYRRQKYALKAVGKQGPNTSAYTTTLSFFTGDDNGEDKYYNLAGILLVLGVSTVIMVVVMVFVGYEKLIHQKLEECCNFIFCKNRKHKKVSKASISPEPLMVRDGRGFDESPSSSHKY